MSTEPTGAAEPGTAAAGPSEPPAPTRSPEPASESSPEPTIESSESSESPESSEVIGSAAEPAPRKRKLGVGALFLTAVLAGPALGVGVGYGVQASRPETPLPKITATPLAYPAARVDPAALAAAAPKPLNIDGDLRELLVKKPDGAQDTKEFGTDGWMDAADIAETFGDTKGVFQQLLTNGFRRAAVVAWEADDAQYRVELLQYLPENTSEVISQLNIITTHADISRIPGNEDGLVVVRKDALHYAKSTEQYYYGEAVARKGTVLMHVQVYGKNPVDPAKLGDLAKRQWERIA
ncbi:hypothetical protein ACIQBJ_09545 [Kitasatospora sp. NPDC088391]|uniref:hypothetical protein n=1 Tax=Kitasatospora sp. NPDC088391 TaxID=3364074 RepID=UPI00382A6A9D